MDGDVDLFERDVEEEKCNGIYAVRQDGAIAFEKAAGDRFISDVTAIDKKVLRVAVRAAFTRSGYKTGNRHKMLVPSGNRQKTVEQTAAEKLKRALAQVFCGRGLQHFAAVVRQHERDLRVSKRVVRDNA